MKKIYAAILMLAMVASFTGVKAQEWNHGKTGIYTVGIGGTQGIYVGNNAPVFFGTNKISWLGMSINHSGEFRVHDWIGVGYQTGINIHFVPGFGTGATHIAIPIMGKANFHILDAVGVGIADKLDVYAGLGLGGGPAFYTSSGNGGVFGIIYVGPQVGTRYWFNDNIAIFGEFGWGATFVNAGVTF